MQDSMAVSWMSLDASPRWPVRGGQSAVASPRWLSLVAVGRSWPVPSVAAPARGCAHSFPPIITANLVRPVLMSDGNLRENRSN